MEHKFTYTQRLILEAAEQKDMNCLGFQDHWREYGGGYDDYSDCHGDYYDAE